MADKSQINEKSVPDQENSSIQTLMEELLAETFFKSVSNFSPEKIQHLVELLEIEDPTNEQEIIKAQKRLEDQLSHYFQTIPCRSDLISNIWGW